MTSDEQTRKAIRELIKAGWFEIRHDGRHTMFDCPCGRHQFPLPTAHRMVSSGVVGKMRKLIKECEEAR